MPPTGWPRSGSSRAGAVAGGPARRRTLPSSDLDPAGRRGDRTLAVLGVLYDTDAAALAETVGGDAERCCSLVQAHPLVHAARGRPPSRPCTSATWPTAVPRAGRRSGDGAEDERVRS